MALSDLSPEFPPETDARRAAKLLLQGYPGPALHLSGEEIVASNTAAAALMNELNRWWGDVEMWLRQTLAHGPRSPITVRFMQEGSSLAIEWTAALLPEAQTVLLGRNVSVEQSLQGVLTESRDRFREIVELSADLAWETGPDGSFTYIAGGLAFGYTPDELIGRKARELLVRRPMEPSDAFEKKEPVTALETWFKRKDGTAARVTITAKPLKTAAGMVRGARGICHDITSEAEQRQALDRAQRRDRMVAQFVKSLREAQRADVALELAAKAINTAMEASGCRIFAGEGSDLRFAAEAGAAAPEAVTGYNKRLREKRVPVQEQLGTALVLGAGTWNNASMNGAIWVWRTGEKGRWAEVDEQLLGDVADHLGIALAQFDYQEKLRILSECDPLTKLLNRRTFMERLNEKIATPRSGGALFYVDLDNFKAVNDQFGHQRGDMVIKKLGEILSHMARPGDIAGRLGGDEFVLWLENIDRAAAEDIAKRIVTAGNTGLRDLSAGPDKPLGVSVGVALAEAGHARRAATLIEMADQAMYQAKQGGKSTWAVAKELKL